MMITPYGTTVTLRTNKGDPQNPEYIKTIRGIGYKLHKVGVAREKQNIQTFLIII